MSTVVKKHLGLRAGYRDNKPVYLFACPTREDGLEKHIAVRVGYLDGKPVYAFTACLPAWPKVIGLRQGYRNSKPVYLWSQDCCEFQPGDFGSSSSSRDVEPRRVEIASSSTSTRDDQVSVPCCPTPINKRLYATLTNNVSGVCSNISPVPSFPIDWDGTKWTGTLAAAAGCVWQASLECVSTGGGYVMRSIVCLSTTAGTGPGCAGVGSGCMIAGNNDYSSGSFTCSPFMLTDALLGPNSGAACCGCVQPPFGGSWQAVYTE